MDRIEPAVRIGDDMSSMEGATSSIAFAVTSATDIEELLAPVLPFRHFRIAIAGLKAAGALPHRIDRSVWSNKLFIATDAEIVSAFRFLRLVDENAAPTRLLTDTVAAFGAEHWRSHLKEVLQASYIDLMTGIERTSLGALLKLFRNRYRMNSRRSRMAVAFFVHASREAQLDVGPFLAPAASLTLSGPRTEREQLSAVMLERLPPFDESWTEELKLAWLAAFRDLVSTRV